MIIGVPTEIKPEEYRVAITPVGVRELTAGGHRVVIQEDAGLGSAISNDDFAAIGAQIMPDAASVFAEADLILKVKEPQLSEVEMLEERHMLFTFLHLAAYPEIARALLDSGATAVAYETVELDSGALPLLAPMSEIAGRMAAQSGAHHLERPHGGRGVLIGGVAGVAPAHVVVLGAGMAGTNAAMVAAGMGADVTILDINIGKLRHIDELYRSAMVTVRSSIHAVEQFVSEADLVVGAVLVPGARAPVVVSEEMVATMRPGSVIVDISIDQGGCIETAHETTHHDPTYLVHDVVHYAVGNIPGAVPNTATFALTNATLPYVVALAGGYHEAAARHPELVPGVNVAKGEVTHRAVAEALGVDSTPADQVL
ncbi:MAG: alanine dehydrogenase [Acidimicrobiia bacterium]|nr:alanine dehydrogenase [Acidimicrobiia bacterium]